MTNSSLNWNKCRFVTMFILTFGFFLVEIIVGYRSNAVSLIADSFHMLSDVAALIIGFLSILMSPKKWSKNTFGWARAEVLGALVNAVFLVALCFSILVEALQKIIVNPELIKDPDLVLIVGAVGLVVNLFGLCLFHQHGHTHGHHSHRSHPIEIKNQGRLTHLAAPQKSGDSVSIIIVKNSNPGNDEDNKSVTENISATVNSILDIENVSVAPTESSLKKSAKSKNMNVRGVFLHILADAIGSIIVIVAASVVKFTTWEYRVYVDPVLSICMTLLILCSTWPLLSESALILLQTIPVDINIEDLKAQLIAKVEGLMAIHEFHIWQLSGDRIIATAHIRCRNQEDYIRIAEQVKEFFHDKGIHSTTIQPEFGEHFPENCFLPCPDPTEKGCGPNTCCGPSKTLPVPVPKAPISALSSNADNRKTKSSEKTQK